MKPRTLWASVSRAWIAALALFGIGRIDRLGRRRRFAHAEGADAARRALDGVGDLAPAFGVAHRQHRVQLAHHVGDLGIEQPQDLGVQRFFAAGVAGEMVKIDGLGQGRFPAFRRAADCQPIAAKAALMRATGFPQRRIYHRAQVSKGRLDGQKFRAKSTGYAAAGQSAEEAAEPPASSRPRSRPASRFPPRP